MRGAKCKRLRKLAKTICDRLQVPSTTTYLRHKVSGELRVAGPRAAYKYAKRMAKQHEDEITIINTLARSIAGAASAERQQPADEARPPYNRRDVRQPSAPSDSVRDTDGGGVPHQDGESPVDTARDAPE